jgi:hypothetical protein
MLTPNDLNILIHCYCCADVHPRIYAPAVQDTIRFFLKDGIIKQTGESNIFRTTAKGNAWLTVILRTPCPTQAWIDDKGNIILEDK